MLKKLSLFKKRLTTVGSDEPLNKLSLAVIILLDIFVLSILFYGLSDHTEQLTDPGEYMPRTAREVFIDQTWTPADRISKLQPMVLSDRKNYSYYYNSIFAPASLKQMHPLCREFYEKVKTASADKKLEALFIERDRKIKDRSRAESEQDKTKKAYDTALLENIADRESAETETIAARSQALTARIEQLTGEIAAINGQINAHPLVQELWQITSPGEPKRQAVVNDYRHFEKGYPFKEFGWQFLFLIPIFALFYAWGNRSVRRDNRIQCLITSHMLVIASIPILVKLIKLVLELIPDVFFRKLFNLLKSLNLIAVWHYIVIIGVIALGLFLIFLIQKKVFNKEKVMQKRMTKGACIRCSKKLPAGAAVCPCCGKKQVAPCSACGKDTPAAGTYCIHCGAQKAGKL